MLCNLLSQPIFSVLGSKEEFEDEKSRDIVEDCAYLDGNLLWWFEDGVIEW